ncbi:MAG: glycine/betaine ABC transporter [Thermoplasmatales archaeon]|jgi:glycine betaine/proline transport system substrate-binding protein|nr:glycine/betaine ABC transporter [Thermoplasmatales archaeon]
MNIKYLKTGALAAIMMLLGTGTYLYAGDYYGADEIEYAGTVLENGAGMGFVVPQHTADKLGITCISDLNDHAGEFGNRIIGVDSGAGIMRLAKKAVGDYGLNFDLVESSEAGMLSELRKKYDAGEDIIVTLWDPHWAFGAYDLVYLEDDPHESFGTAESIESWVRNGLLDEDPDLAGILERYSYDLEDFNSLLMHIRNSPKDVSEAVEDWLALNPDMRDAWIGDVEKADRGRIRIGLVNWACAIGTSNVLKHLLEEVGYTVEIVPSETGAMYTGLAYGSTDVITTAWLPLTHEEYMDRYGPRPQTGGPSSEE